MKRGAFFLGIGLVVAQAAPVYPHAKLLAANPAKDSIVPGSFGRVELNFGEPIEPSLSYLELLDSKKKRLIRVHAKDACKAKTCEFAVPALPDGKYRVHSHVLSADGHVVDEEYDFTVKSGQ